MTRIRRLAVRSRAADGWGAIITVLGAAQPNGGRRPTYQPSVHVLRPAEYTLHI